MSENLWISSTNIKGQATIPGPIRSLLHIKAGVDKIGFRLRKGRVEMVPVSVKEKKLHFSKKDWEKIEKLRTRGRGKTFHSAKEAAEYFKSL
jgi:bifunctional DNA-binding transcriptional regulator/antitoxin component of YhaV-PrlF toxin-antitoxin module